MCRSSDLYLFGGLHLQSKSLPSRIAPVTGFRQKAFLSTYSGGTVQDLHLIILFSEMRRTRTRHKMFIQLSLPDTSKMLPPCTCSFSDWQMSTSLMDDLNALPRCSQLLCKMV